MTSESDLEVDWPILCAIASIVVGLILVLLSIVLPNSALGHGGWSTEQAQQYQQAANKLHSLSHASIHAPVEKRQTLRKELKEAEEVYAARRAELDTAIGRPKRMTTALRISGVVLAIFGGAGAYYASKTAES